jgi:hypothetical protein
MTNHPGERITDYTLGAIIRQACIKGFTPHHIVTSSPMPRLRPLLRLGLGWCVTSSDLPGTDSRMREDMRTFYQRAKPRTFSTNERQVYTRKPLLWARSSQDEGD